MMPYTAAAAKMSEMLLSRTIHADAAAASAALIQLSAAASPILSRMIRRSRQKDAPSSAYGDGKRAFVAIFRSDATQ